MAVAASVGLVWKSCRCAQPPCVANRGASWRVRLCVLGADARSDTDVYSARSAAMAGSACAQEEHRSERRPNGRTSARGGALSEWSRRRRAFANAAAQRCKSVQSVMDTSQSVRTARVRGPATTVQVVGRGGGRTRLLLLCTGPSRSVVSSLIGYFLQWALSIPVQKMLRCSLRLDCCQWAGRRPLALSRRLKLAAAGPLSGLATSTRRQRAGSQGIRPRPGSGLDAATARPARGRARFGPRSDRGTRRRPQRGARAGPARWVRSG